VASTVEARVQSAIMRAPTYRHDSVLRISFKSTGGRAFPLANAPDTELNRKE